jgi:hypothetical protein
MSGEAISGLRGERSVMGVGGFPVWASEASDTRSPIGWLVMREAHSRSRGSAPNGAMIAWTPLAWMEGC